MTYLNIMTSNFVLLFKVKYVSFSMFHLCLNSGQGQSVTLTYIYKQETHHETKQTIVYYHACQKKKKNNSATMSIQKIYSVCKMRVYK